MKIPEYVDKEAIVLAIDNWIIGKNAERNRKIIYRRLIDGIGYEKLAEEFLLSVTQVKNIVYQNEKKVFAHIPGFK